jgi:hypothetical protein
VAAVDVLGRVDEPELGGRRHRGGDRSISEISVYTYFLGIANYEQFQIGVSMDYLAMIITSAGSAPSSAPSSGPSSSPCCPS